MDISIFKSGSEEAAEKVFTEFYNKHRKNLWYLAKYYLNDGEEGYDIIAEAFIKVWGLRANFETEEKMLSFLRVAIRNACTDLKRHESVKRQYEKQLEVENETFIPANVSIESYLHDILKEEIERLPPRCRQVLELSLQDYSSEEIAKVLDISIQTVYNQQHRAIQKLKNAARDKNLATASILLAVIELSYLSQN